MKTIRQHALIRQRPAPTVKDQGTRVARRLERWRLRFVKAVVEKHFKGKVAADQYRLRNSERREQRLEK